MARVRIHQEKSLPWTRPQSNLTREELEKLGDGELTTQVRIREMGGADRPQLVELRYEENAEIQLHAHDEDEIIFILKGEMHVGNRVLEPGASLYIAGGTLYGFKAGPGGLQILNFRPRQDMTFITKEEFMLRKRGGNN